MVYGWHIYTKISQETYAIMLLIILLLRDTGKFLCAAHIRLNIKKKDQGDGYRLLPRCTGLCGSALGPVNTPSETGLDFISFCPSSQLPPLHVSVLSPSLSLSLCWGIAFLLVCLLPLCSLQSAFRREAEWLYNLPDRTITSNNAVQGN